MAALVYGMFICPFMSCRPDVSLDQLVAFQTMCMWVPATCVSRGQVWWVMLIDFLEKENDVFQVFITSSKNFDLVLTISYRWFKVSTCNICVTVILWNAQFSINICDLTLKYLLLNKFYGIILKLKRNKLNSIKDPICQRSFRSFIPESNLGHKIKMLLNQRSGVPFP